MGRGQRGRKEREGNRKLSGRWPMRRVQGDGSGITNQNWRREREMETNETCPAKQEWNNKLLMEKERWGGRRAEREDRGQRVERVTSMSHENSMTKCSVKQRYQQGDKKWNMESDREEANRPVGSEYCSVVGSSCEAARPCIYRNGGSHPTILQQISVTWFGTSIKGAIFTLDHFPTFMYRGQTESKDVEVGSNSDVLRVVNAMRSDYVW